MLQPDDPFVKRKRRAADELTLKQQRFAQEYVKLNGNGTRAAEAAGYKGDDNTLAVRASESVRKSKIRREIDRLVRQHEISAKRVLTRLDNLSFHAESEGQFSAAIKAEELLGKSLGMWIDRSESLTVNVSGEHLEALMSLARSRRARSGQVIDATDLDATQDVVSTGQEQG